MSDDVDAAIPSEGAASHAAHAGDPDFMLSLARGLAVVRAFTESRRRLTISQISLKTGLSRAAVRRCLYTLEKLGYVAEEAKVFSLRPQILALGHAYLSSTPLAVSAQPFLDEVSRSVRQSSSIATLDGDEIVYICRSAVTRVMSINLLVGTRLPAYCTSMGQVLLAHLPPDELAAYLARVKLVAQTNRTSTSAAKLRKDLVRVQAKGYALLDQELEVGLRSIAVPVRDSGGRVVAAMNIGAQASQVGLDEMTAKYLPRLRQAADDLQATLLN